ncbi:MAG TPA: restriction endonuclease subunit S, partial [Methylomirabilota bacterium]|nr:restriction endonuclease subunit S [Methylomirabilota bacterium]
PNWATVRLGEICNFRNGINYTKDSSGERIKILGVKDFQDNFYAPVEDLDYITADGQINENDLVNESDIVFVRSNGNQRLIGRCLLMGKVEERITHSGFTIRLILKSRELDPVFLTHVLKLSAFRQRMFEGGTGANIKSLNQGTLSNLTIPYPPMEVQKQIVSQLEEEQKLINTSDRLIEIFEQKIKDKIAEVWGE